MIAERGTLADTIAMVSAEETIRSEAPTDESRRPDRSHGRVRAGFRLPEFRREERREFRYVLSIALAVLCSWVMRLMPIRLRYWVADTGGSLYFRLSKTYRENVCANLAQVMQQEAMSPNVVAAARRVFRTSGRNFADLLVTPHFSRQRFVDQGAVQEGSWSILDDVLAEGKGAVVVTAHLGAFDYLGQTLHANRYKITSVTGRTTARFLFDAITYLRRSHGASIVEATPSGVRRVIYAIRRGECAAFLTDRDFFQNGRPVTFFGRATTLPPGPVRIARDTGAPIVPIFSVRIGQNYGVRIFPPVRVEKTGDIDADLDAALRQLVTILENAINATPEQWVMFQRVWPAAPVDPVRVFPVGSPLESDLLKRVDAVLPPRRPDES